MNSLIINSLYIFSVNEKKARLFEFSKGKNIITSSKTDGNKVGKSILMKSLYYTLGADCHFDDRWDAQNKIFIENITINGKKYIIYRYDRLFKIFSKNNQIFITTDRKELGNYLANLYQFSVMLPNRHEEKLEVTPPVFSYLLNFIDQDKMNGTSFDSFSNLTQYPDYKENLLYSHFGVFNENYYDSKHMLDSLKAKQTELTSNLKMIKAFIDKIKQEILDVDFSLNMDVLNCELDNYKMEYSEIISQLGKTKDKLIQYRNQREDLNFELIEICKTKTLLSNDLKKINNHTCPLCSSEIVDNITLRSQNYNSFEDFVILSNALEMELQKIDKKIETEKEKYNKKLEMLNRYQKKLGKNNNEINDIFKQQGAIEIRDKLIKELGEIQAELDSINSEIEKINYELKKYKELKDKINREYYKLMASDKVKFDLQEIENDSFENIRSVYKAQGSNRCIATVVWYYNLLKIKNKFNPNAIKFPLVIDSPTDVELDHDKESLFWEYILNEYQDGVQLFVSSLGFDKDEHIHNKTDKVIEIESPKYGLLSSEDYYKYKEILAEYSRSDV